MYVSEGGNTMDWITGLQRALDYIEEHITEPVDFAEVAKAACVLRNMRLQPR